MGVFIRTAAALATLLAGVALAQVAPGHRDAEAIDVLKAMDAHTASLNDFTVSVEYGRGHQRIDTLQTHCRFL